MTKQKPKKHPGGRPTKYKPELCLTVEYMARAGLIDAEISRAIGVSESTLNDWKNKYPEFLESLKRGRDEPDSAVEQSLYKRAMGMVMKEEVIEEVEGADTPGRKKTVYKQIPPDATAMIFWLKNRKPKEWRDKQVMEHEVGEDSGLVIIKGKISVEEWQKKE